MGGSNRIKGYTESWFSTALESVKGVQLIEHAPVSQSIRLGGLRNLEETLMGEYGEVKIMIRG